MLYEHEEDGNLIPDPSDVKTVQKETSEVVSLAYCDTIEYRKLHDNQAVKKPLTISYANFPCEVAFAGAAGAAYSSSVTICKFGSRQRVGDNL